MPKKAAKKSSRKSTKKTSKKTSKSQNKSPRKTQVEKAAAQISKAESSLKEIRKLDAETKDVVTQLSDAKYHFKRKDYKTALSHAKKAMKIGELSKKTKEARDEVVELKRSIKRAAKGLNLSEAFEILEATEVALKDSNFRAFKSLLSEAKKSVTQAKQSKKIQEELDATRASVEDLRKMGAVTLESEILLSEAEEALKLKDIAKSKDLIKAVRKWIDIETLERERHELLLSQDQKEVTEKLSVLSPVIDEFDKLGIDTSAMTESITQAREALDDGDFVRAKRCALELEDIIRSLKGSSLRAARETIERARDRIEKARVDGVGVLVAERSLQQAERAFVRGEFKDSIDFAHLAETFVKRSMGRRKTVEERPESDIDYTEALIAIGRMVSDKDAMSVEVSVAPEESRRIIDDSVTDLESTYLTLRAQEDLESMRSTIDKARENKAGVGEAKIMLRKAQDAFKVENYAAVTVLERTVRDLLHNGKGKKGKSAS